jgi:multifunctional 2-oxoglutarate metabolism enzyme
VAESSTGASTSQQTDGNQSGDDPLSEFGANEWLVDEMFQRYQKDPSSVDKAWESFFEKHGDGSTNGGGKPNGSAPGPAPAKSRPASSEAPKQTKPRSASTSEAPKQTKPRSASTPEAPKRTKPRSASTPEPAATSSGARSSDKPAVKKPAAAKPATKVPSTSPVPKEPEPAPKPKVDDEPTFTVLRGAPARTVANMDASLAVPTATSVRSVPVKLLIDNRVVINNHLARARGGKVSFTHLIGYALVKALTSMPEMNNGFEIVDGKPNLITPAHINLGLAIDMAKPDGTRQLLVPSIKGTETMNFAAFWTAYEDVVRKARAGKLTVADFQGTTVSLTNPGTIGTNHSVPRLMNGQGAIVGVGSMDYPQEYQGA